MRVRPPSAVSSRRSLAAVAWAVLSAGCLDEPPTFAPRGQIPPFILAGRVEPPLGAVYEGLSNSIPINVPFRSEDVDIPLEARLYLDLAPGAERGNASPESVLVPPGNFEDLTRSVTIDWSGPVDGCHSLTMILTYAGNYGVLGLPSDDTRAARVVWWLNMGEFASEVRMATCPGASQSDSVLSVP